MRRILPALALVATAATLSGHSDAQGRARVLHRPIPGDLPLDLTVDRRPLAPSEGVAGVQSAAGPGAAWRERQPVDEQSIARPSPQWEPPVRDMRLDRDTRSPPGTRLSYTEVFTPSVSPFKRLRAYDALSEAGTLTVRDPSQRGINVGAAPAWIHARRHRFVGELLVELAPDAPTLVPGVAGEQRVVSFATSDNRPLEFSRDSAGNLFVRGLEAGTVRLSYVVEAPEHAFHAPSVPPISLAAAAGEIPEAERPRVPSWLRAAAPVVLRRVGVTDADTLDVALARLVGYFRAFRDADMPDQQGADLYTDLALGGVGACRHRAYAMVATLHAIGVPARYVGNEAHAWAEVFVTRVGWVRIDLGGWDVPLDARAPSDRPQFRTPGEDPWPRPSEYVSGYSAALGNNVGRGDAGAGAQGHGGGGDPQSGNGAGEPGRAGEDDPRSAASGAGGGGGGGGRGAHGGGGAGGRGAGNAGERASAGGDPRVMAAGVAEGTRDDASEGDEGESLAPTTLLLGPVRADEAGGFEAGGGFVRGSMVRVEGEARDEQGAGIGGLAIEVQLVRNGRVVQSLGASVTRPDGRWDARVLLPPSLDAGEYTVRASTPGDTRHAPAHGE